MTEKLRYDLIPWDSVTEIARVMTAANLTGTHGEDSWKTMDPKKNKQSILRHLMAYLNGEVIDPQFNLMHLSHLATRLLFEIQYEKERSCHTQEENEDQ